MPPAAIGPSTTSLPTGGTATLPAAWPLLEHALRQRRAVSAGYHGHDRILCPHAMGSHHGRATVLAYQTGGTTSTGALPTDPRKRWRWLYIDQLHDPRLTNQPWQTADNYTPNRHPIDHVLIAIDATQDLPTTPIKV